MSANATTEAVNSTATLLKTKPHFETLDGLRGIAAVSVVIFHFMEIAVPDYTDSFIGHGYLAVDFFFCLSGFVIAYAYDNRIEQIGAIRFFGLRLIRLEPLVIIGSLIGLAGFLFDPLVNLYATRGAVKTVFMFIASCLMVPYPTVPERYNNLFHLNPPTWSLMWEYIANIFYALILYKLRNKTLWILLVIAACLLCFTAFQYGHLSVGWGADSFAGGVPRVFFSFIAGMIVYRSGRIIPSSLDFPVVSLLLLVAFTFPFINGANRFTEPLVVMFYFPFLVALGAGAQPSQRMRRVCKFSGDISYPVYMIHYPFIWLFQSYHDTLKPAMGEMVVVIIVSVCLLIGLAYVILTYIDAPIRNYFSRKLKKSAAL